ncbi:MAG TPA: hypothetical protein VIC55_00410 [Gemmatimonadaceae bacterium]
MNVVAFLPDPLLGRLRSALGSDHTVIVVTEIVGDRGLAAQLDRGAADLVVIDPGDRRLERRTHTLVVLFAQHSVVPVLIYTTLGPASIPAAAQLLREGTRELLLVGLEDQPGAMRAMVVRITMHALAERFLTATARQLAQLPPSVARALQALFATPRRYRSVEDIALAAAVTRRHLARVTRRAGFASCRDLLAVARVLSTYRLVQHEHCSLGRAAAQLATDPRALARQVRVTASVASLAHLAALDPDELLGRCVRMVCRPSGVASRPLRVRRPRSLPLV